MAKKTTEQIKKEMAANSAAWHTADASTKKQLEAANQELGKQIGGSYNSASGTWSDSSGKSLYTSSGGSSGNSGGNSQYAQNTNIDYGTLGQSQMANGASWQEVWDTYIARQNKINGSEDLKQYDNDAIQRSMLQYVNQQKAIEQYQNMLNEYDKNNQKEEYQNQYDPQIEALLNQILNRDDFSYDVASDPLYQQYKEMYQREGDRAMRETLAEAAAGAGGMNSYAITAASQANNYYNSQLNDKIPELYQLAYNMYINDKESKVQDLGILQNMDATQYSRYRDTINDWYNDKQFAYGVYQDAVQQGNWQTTYDNNNYWANKEFDNSNFWKDKEFNANQAEIDYNKTTAEQEKAESRLWEFIDRGIMPSDEIIAAANTLSKADVERLVAAAQAEKAKTGSPSKGGDPDDDDGNDPEGNPTGDSNFTTVSNACKEMAIQGNELGAAACAKEAFDAGYITQEEYNYLLNQYNPMLGWMTAGSQTYGANK